MTKTMTHIRYEVLWELVNNSIRFDGKMKEQNLKEREEEELMDKLRTWLSAFKMGEDIYLPFAAKLKGFRAVWAFICSTKKPEEVYAKVRTLIEELANLQEPRPIHEESIRKCKERVPPTKRSEAEIFSSKYLSINRITILQILDMLTYYVRSMGTIDILQYAIALDKLDDVCNECKDVKVGSSKDDTIRKRLYALARFYDNLFIILGAAAHEPMGYEGLWFHRGRKTSYTLLVTPLTASLRFVLMHPSKSNMDDYVRAYKEFVSEVVRSYTDDIVLATAKTKMVLSKYLHIGVDVSDNTLRRTISVLRRLLNTL